MGAVQSVWGFGFGALLGFFLVVSDTASQTVSLILGCAACLFFQGAAGLVLYAAFRVGRRAKAAASAIAVEPSPAD